ncbi:uncharacterized protein DUF59 [Murinocardiopsis flavida]|uniref:Uncharacterized protein DUF59 n=1 Tax=Murinocardiopsis flavida TaxID=645275 RepID=A0A2P8CPM8_9ACTN|nr:iron-sulfur cluster assembly protein [Murinocardiopsis flavida]PSK86902.1 uncharacterized protein DUF59 [Murinocardiopsis flavida]
MTAGAGPPVPITAVWQALATVRDPELDEPITDLGFVASVDLDRTGAVTAELRLPTYFCAPNFAFLMVADAHDALRALPGVAAARVRLIDHFAAAEITSGVAAGGGFGAAFPETAADGRDGLDDLRRTFWRKAHAACQELLAFGLLTAGSDHAELVRLRLGDLAGRVDRAGLDRLRRRRADLGLPDGDGAPLLLGDDGTPLTAAELPIRLRIARTTRLSIEGNADWCRGLLRTRYPERSTGTAG